MTLSSLHLPTFLLATLICYVIVGLQLLLALRHLRARNGLAFWVAGVWMSIGAHALLLLRQQLSDPVALMLSNGAFMASVVLMGEALSLFLQRRRFGWPWRLVFAIGLAGTLAATWLPTALRVPLVSYFVMLPCLAALHLLWRRRRQAEAALGFVALALGLLVLMLLARGAEAVLVPDAYLSLTEASPLRVFSFLSLFVLLIGGSFGFLLAILQRSNARLAHLAKVDPLTACLNRRAAEQVTQHTLHRARRESTPLALLLLDLDHFKRINDRHGHAAGDLVLRRFAAALRSRLRDSDVLARLGGEEFSVLLPATDVEGALAVAESLRQTTADLRLRDEHGLALEITVSIGLACQPAGRSSSADQLYRRADAALYAAKSAGRNRVQLAARTDHAQPA